MFGLWEDASCYRRSVALRAKINYPAFLDCPSQVFAHTCESRSAKIRRGRDQGNDSRRMVWVCVEDLPGPPSPEVDTQIRQTVFEFPVSVSSERVKRWA